MIDSDRGTVSGRGRCRVCGKPLTQPDRGRPPVLCDTCRKGVKRASVGAATGDAGRFSQALRHGMQQHGFTLRALARHVGELGGSISPGALGRWVDGRSVPSDPLDSQSMRALELLFERQIGDLSLIFEPTEPAVEPTSERVAQQPLTEFAGGPADDLEALHAAARALQEWIRKVTGPQRVLVQKVGTETAIDTNRRLKSTTSFLTVRAMHDLVDCYFFPHAYTAGPMPKVEAREGCEVSPRELRNHPQVEAVELIFPKALERGETHTFSFTVHYPEGEDEEETYYGRAFPSLLAEVSLKISFEIPPQRLRACRWPLGSTGSGPEIESRELPPGTREAEITLSPAPLAGLGWSWRW